MDGNVNKPNVRIWGFENPHEVREVSRNSEKVTVWCAFSTNLVLRPCYFDDSIFTGDSYLHLLNIYFLPILSDITANNIFQQDTASLHISRAVLELVNDTCQIHRLDKGVPCIGQLGPLILFLLTSFFAVLSHANFKTLDSLVCPS